MVRTFLVASLLMISALITVFAQRSSDYRDPDTTYDEGWTTLFNGKDFSGWVPVIQNPETKSAKKYRESEISEQNTFSIEEGMIATTGTPNVMCAPQTFMTTMYSTLKCASRATATAAS